MFAFGNNHLRDAVAAVDNERLVGQINKDDANLPAIVDIDGAGRVQDGDAAFERKAAAGPHLAFVAFGDFHIEARRHEAALHRFKRYRAFGQEARRSIPAEFLVS